MKTDRELLELAAKAGGIEYFAISVNDGRGLLLPPRDDKPLAECALWWNPLTQDGDALRLAVKLNVAIDPMVPDLQDPSSSTKFSVALLPNRMRFSVLHGGDRLAATRRAIVRAAADLAPKDGAP